MPDNFAYINARLRAMHAGLVTKKLDEALNATSYSEFLRVLSESSMGADLGDATAQGAGLAQLDKALSRSFYSSAQKVVGMADGSAGKDIGLLFARYDLLNLKAVARGKFSNRSSDDIEASLVPAGTLKPSVLASLAGANDLNALVGVLGLSGTPLASAFRKAVVQLASDGDLLAFEVALDTAYYTTATTQADSSTLKAYLRRELDGANILTAFKLKAQGRTTDLEKYFLKGGSSEVGLTRFTQIATGNGGLEGLTTFAAIGEAGDLSSVETAVRNVMLKNAKHLYASDPLGMGVTIGFLKEKENEVALTRLIARGKFYNVPNETLRKEVGNGL
jgi:V/A-type H+/Na+-transporting ATPase subunit C